MGKGWAAAAAVCAVSFAVPSRASADPWLTIAWIPIVAPAQLVMHELSHAAAVKAFGGQVTEVSFLSNGRFGNTSYTGISSGIPVFAVGAAPRILDVTEMLLFTALRNGESNRHLRGL